MRRVVALADSFAVGPVPYPANFLTRLDELLDAREPTEVLNFGVVAIGPREYLQLWRDEAAAYHPDLVLLCLFVGNDIQKNSSRSLFHREVLMVYAVPRRVLSLAGATQAAGDAGHRVGDLRRAGYLRVEVGRSKVCLREPPSDLRRAWRETFSVLDDLVREVGPRLRVVIIPDELQVSDPLFAAVTAGREADYDRERPQRRAQRIPSPRAACRASTSAGAATGGGLRPHLHAARHALERARARRGRRRHRRLDRRSAEGDLGGRITTRSRLDLLTLSVPRSPFLVFRCLKITIGLSNGQR